jgi:hypothetical protein
MEMINIVYASYAQMTLLRYLSRLLPKKHATVVAASLPSAKVPR